MYKAAGDSLRRMTRRLSSEEQRLLLRLVGHLALPEGRSESQSSTPDKISESTSRTIEGKLFLFVQSVIPELYERFHSHRKEVEKFIASVSRQVVLDNKKLVREYIRGHLEGKKNEMAKVLFVFFVELEEYLREVLAEFIAKNQLSPKEVYDTVGVPINSRKHITMGHLLNVVGHVANKKQLAGDDIAGNWNALSELRNRLSHGDLNLAKEWSAPLETILQYSPRLVSLVALIASCTGREGNFTYLPGGRR